MPDENKRLLFLEKMTREGSTDPLAWYGLAVEYRNRERYAEALQTFITLRARTPDYVAMYLICGQMLAKLDRASEARAWFEAGIDAARRKPDPHALGELEGALATLAG